ncbi:MAG TPA: ABC transporter ATP-binding protein [Candidatus Acidoferrales bacterium]|nr:ABC transporter ATP-binding protein [Candidatus Acidoferrales bacterium]
MHKQGDTGVAVAEEQPRGVSPRREEILRTEALCKIFLSGGQEIVPVDGIDLTVERGEMTAIVGSSGAGKSTLLHLLAALDTPTSGAVYFAGSSLGSLAEAQLAEYRNHSVGFVWQRHHLLPDFTAAENVAMPLLVKGIQLGAALRTAHEWLDEVGLAPRAGQRAGQLSGGEQQRVAIARALVNGPALLLADEPTGDLDERSAENIFELMQRLHRSHHLTSILATHNLSLARRMDRALLLERGKLSPAREALAGIAAGTARTAGAGAKTLGERG